MKEEEIECLNCEYVIATGSIIFCCCPDSKIDACPYTNMRGNE